MKICTVVGARPQFIKAAPLSKELSKFHEEILIHTGQHFDANMSDIFFDELDMKKPDYNLGISGGTHGKMTGEMLIKLEEVFIKETPDIVLVYGDTNSTLAAGLAAVKLHIPIVHVEAGPRTFLKTNPEENNRICVDHLSEILFCPDEISKENLKKEGIISNVYNVGDIMYDTFLFAKEKADKEKLLEKYNLENDNYIFMTLHRAENTDNRERLEQILDFVCKIDKKIIFPIHPRTVNVLKKYGLEEKLTQKENIIMTQPMGYIDTVGLASCASLILTDSGGLSKESYYAGAKCIFLFDADIWHDLINTKWLQKIDFKNKEYLQELLNIANTSTKVDTSDMPKFYGNGDTSQRIVSIINNHNWGK